MSEALLALCMDTHCFGRCSLSVYLGYGDDGGVLRMTSGVVTVMERKRMCVVGCEHSLGQGSTVTLKRLLVLLVGRDQQHAADCVERF